MNDPSASQKWGNIIAREQLLSGVRQERSLQQLNQQIGALRDLQHQQFQAQLAWQQQQQWQALLQQVLYDTEENAELLLSVASVDAFAAACRARLWLCSLADAGITPSQYTAVEHKRALTETARVLEEIAHGDVERTGNLVDRVVAAWRRHDYLRHRLGDGNDARIEDLQQTELLAESEASRLTMRARTALAVAVVAAVVVGGGLVFGLTTQASQADGLGLGLSWVAAVVFLLAAIRVRQLAVIRIGQLQRQASEAGSRRAGMRASLDDYQAFLADSDGGQLIEQAMREHPALVG